MKIILALLGLFAAPAHAQQPVTVIGPVTVGNCAQFFSSSQIKSAAGGCAGTVTDIPSGTPMLGSLLATAIAAPVNPGAGKSWIYVDSTTKALVNKDETGQVHTTIIPGTAPGGSFVTGINDSGVLSFGGVTIPSGANPIATAGPTAINGSASTFMRSDAAPAVQTGSNSQKGLLQCDGLTAFCTGGSITVVGGSTTAIDAGGATTGVTNGAGHSVMVQNSSNFLDHISPGTSGYAFMSNGASADPSYQGFTAAGTGASTRTWQAKARDRVSVLDFGADPTCTNDSASSFNAAIAASGGAQAVWAPTGCYLIGAVVSAPKVNSGNVAIIGDGVWNTVIRRKPSYTSGDIFLFDVAGGGGTLDYISNLRIEAGGGAPFHVTSGAALHIKAPVVAKNLYIVDGFRGVWIDDTLSNTIDNVQYLQTAGYSASFSSDAGLLVTGHSTAIISNSTFQGQDVSSVNNLTNGIRIEGADGLQLSNIAGTGQTGMAIQGGHGSPIDDIYVVNGIFDNCTTNAVTINGTNAPNVFTNIRFVGSHFNQGHAGGADGITVSGDADYIEFNGGNINLSYGSGMVIDTSATAYHGGPHQSVIVDAVDISENNTSNTAGLSGIVVANNSSGFHIRNNTIGNRSAAGHQAYGISLGSSLSNGEVQNNNLAGNAIGPLFPASSAGYTNVLIFGNNPQTLAYSPIYTTFLHAVDADFAGTVTMAPTNATGVYLCISGTTITYELTSCPPSDRAVKHDIVPIDDPKLLDKILAQRGVRFTYNEGKGAPGRRIGVIANEWERPFPELVDHDPDGTRHFDYAATWGLTVEALRQLRQEIYELKAEKRAASKLRPKHRRH